MINCGKLTIERFLSSFKKKDYTFSVFKMDLKKCQVVFMVDRVDGKPYQCKILDIREDLIKIYYHQWNSK